MPKMSFPILESSMRSIMSVPCTRRSSLLSVLFNADLLGDNDSFSCVSLTIDLNGGRHSGREDDVRRHLIDMDADGNALG
jgi:hypothetical protein